MTTKTRGSLTISGRFSRSDTSWQYNKSGTMAPLDSVSSVSTPGYFSKVRNGKVLPVNPFSSTQREITSLPGHFRTEQNYRGRGWKLASKGEGDYAASYLLRDISLGRLPALPPLSDYDYLVTEAEAKARSGSWDIGTMAAEFGKTTELVRRAHHRTYNRAHDIVKNLKRRDRTLQNFSDAWLELRYGWRPLMYDIQAAEEAYLSLQRGKEKLLRASASSSEDDETYVVKPESTVWNYGDSLDLAGAHIIHNVVQTKTSLKVRAGVGHKRSFQNQTAFIDPVTTAWELVPFSFVADWFINIGDNLTAFSPFFSGEPLFAYISLQREIEVTMTAETLALPNSGGYSHRVASSSPSVAALSQKDSRREARSNVPFELAFRPKINYANAVDLLALALMNKTKLLRLLKRTTI